MEQLKLFSSGARSGAEIVEPIKHGDIIVTKNHKRHVVISVSDNIHGLVFVCLSLTTGADSIVLAREVAYRSR